MSFKDKNIVLCAPVDTRSGYGARSRDLARALLLQGYNLQILSVPWGSTPQNVLQTGKDDDLLNIIVPNLREQPNIFIHCVIPNEFQAIGKYNIGITAGIETTACAPEWIEGCNKMDLVLTSSEHSKKVFEETSYEKRDSNTNAVADIVKLKTPVEVLFEGVNTNLFKKIDNSTSFPELDEAPEDFLFLNMGMWTDGNLGNDRKDIGMTIYTFLSVFNAIPKGYPRPGLVLKTSGARFSTPQKNQILDKIRMIYNMLGGYKKDFPNIYFIHGDLTDAEVNELYNHPKIKAMVSFTKGEGFGRPLLEFTTTGKPIIASNWSGQVDFLHPKKAFLLGGELKKVDKSSVNKWIIENSHWFTVKYDEAGKTLFNCFMNYDIFLTRSERHIDYTLENFTFDIMAEKLENFIENIKDYIGKKIVKPIRKIIKLKDEEE